MSKADEFSNVVDDKPGHRFVVALDGGEAELVYRVNGHRLVLVHTEVPETLRGHGIAGYLVRAAAERAVAEAMTIVPACPYARRWLRDHSDVAATVAIDWGPEPSSGPD